MVDSSDFDGSGLTPPSGGSWGGLSGSQIGGLFGLAGIGTSLAGTGMQVAASKAIASDSANIAGLDEQVNAQRQQQMVLTSNRMQLQNIRNSQMARSMAQSSAVNQGAQFGSGLAGGYGQISGQAGTNQLANSQNLQIGQTIFGLDNQIDQQKINIASEQGSMATGQGISALGGAIGGIGKIAGMFMGT